MRPIAPALIATHLGAAALGWALTDKRPVDTEVKHSGYFTVETTQILAATVASLRDENRMLVFSYRGNADVRAEHRWLWLFRGRQELSVPGVVNYYVDLSSVTLADVSYNETAKIVTVRLPRVTLGDIAFQPELASASNGGVLTWSEDEVEALRKLNYKAARRAMVAQAQQPGLLNAAKRQAITNISSLFEVPLRIAGQPEIKVVATFR